MSVATERRSVIKGAAWSVPIIAAAGAAPAMAASCTPSLASITNIIQGTNSITFTLSTGFRDYTVQMVTSVASNTDVSPANLQYYAGQGEGHLYDDFCGMSLTPYEFGPSNVIVLNQRKDRPLGSAPCDEPDQSVPPSQTVTFTFYEGIGTGGPQFTPTNFSISVFDISSASGSSDRNRNYWDTVGFSVTPTSITSATGGQCLAGTGAGTIADPFQRTTDAQATGTCNPDFQEIFSFASFPSGSQMVYSQEPFWGGWQFISINGISFTGPC